MLRITTGLAKNVRLKTPDLPGFKSVQEVAKSAIFSMLGDKVNEAMCLDLYAGSGNLGLEALSRGAAWCDLVDNNYEAKKVLLENVKKCGFEEKAEVHFKDAVKYAANTEKKYDLIFVDPFYDTTSHVFLMKNLAEILKPEGVVVFCHGVGLLMDSLIKSAPLKTVENRRFGQGCFTFIKKV